MLLVQGVGLVGLSEPRFAADGGRPQSHSVTSSIRSCNSRPCLSTYWGMGRRIAGARLLVGGLCVFGCCVDYHGGSSFMAPTDR